MFEAQLVADGQTGAWASAVCKRICVCVSASDEGFIKMKFNGLRENTRGKSVI